MYPIDAIKVGPAKPASNPTCPEPTCRHSRRDDRLSELLTYTNKVQIRRECKSSVLALRQLILVFSATPIR